MDNNAGNAHQTQDGLLLMGLDGTNPLGFLAALGTLQTLTNPHSAKVAMSWAQHQSSWTPVLHGVGLDHKSIASTLAKQLKCGFQPAQDAESKRDHAERDFHRKRAELKRTSENLKKRSLRGNERKGAEDQELRPIRDELGLLRLAWLGALRDCVPSLELSLGKHLNAPCEELRGHMLLGIDECHRGNRRVIDLYSSFGSDICHHGKSGQMQATPFCFITGSGHQYFLDTVRGLVTNVTEAHFEKALFYEAERQDEKLSMRWDPQEDRRYAVMWSDPTASGNEAKTNWALNLLAYHGLQLLPSVPRARGLSSTGWNGDEDPAWTWPIWTGRLISSVVRSLLSHPSLVGDNIDFNNLRSIGISAIYRAVRIQVGNPPLNKINFTPAFRIG